VHRIGLNSSAQVHISAELDKNAPVCRNTNSILNATKRGQPNSSKNAPGCTNGTQKDFLEGIEYEKRNVEKRKDVRKESVEVSSGHMQDVDIEHFSQRRCFPVIISAVF
jgi:hypothetical protein